ncbi:MAG: alginate export family protein [Nevskia sp.]|nr:alginate export family protein [Nevskia sp.]
MNRPSLLPIAAAGLLATASMPCAAVEIGTALRTSLGGQADGARDLGLGDQSSNEILYVNLAPRLSIEFSRDWVFYLRARAFMPTGDVLDTDEGQTTLSRRVSSFVKLDEAWMRFGGFTSYPGESVRIGHQFIRENERGFVGRDVDALYWVLNTTRFQSSAGVFYQFNAYRSDGIDLPLDQRKRVYGYGNISTDWMPQHQVGFRGLHARDVGGLPGSGQPINAETKLEEVNLTWLGVYLSNGYLNPRKPNTFKYWLDATYLVGNTLSNTVAANRLTGGLDKQSISAVASTVGVRWRPGVLPLLVGAEYAYSGGGTQSQYRQSGLQSNGTPFTGITTSTYRYNEALRAQLGNLRVATLYTSYSLPNDEVSLIVQKFNKDDRFAPILTNNVSAETGPSSDIGYGIDVVASHYLPTFGVLKDLYEDDDSVSEDPRSAIRLRASLFNPGKAYASGADINYRVILEASLWVF